MNAYIMYVCMNVLYVYEYMYLYECMHICMYMYECTYVLCMQSLDI
jgi:hypothetical protein